MGNDFDSIGISGMDSPRDTEKFYRENINCADEFEINGEKYSILSIGNGAELYFYGDSEKIYFNYCELFFTPENSINAAGVEWVAPDEDCGPNFINVELTDLSIPCNVCVPDFYRYKNLSAQAVKKMNIIAFPRRLSVYESAEEYLRKGKSRMASEALMPCGTFSANGDKNFIPDNTIFLNGVIERVKQKKNRIGGGEFFQIGVKCIGTIFELVVEAAAATEDGYTFNAGNVISGKFALVGKILF